MNTPPTTPPTTNAAATRDHDQTVVRAFALDPFKRVIEDVLVRLPRRELRLSKASNAKGFLAIETLGTTFSTEEGDGSDNPPEYQLIHFCNPVHLCDPGDAGPQAGFRLSLFSRSYANETAEQVLGLFLDEKRRERTAPLRSSEPPSQRFSGPQAFSSQRWRYSEYGGRSLFVAYKTERASEDQESVFLKVPTDIPCTPDWLFAHLLEWTRGTSAQFPRFTCDLGASFAEPRRRRMNLRLENSKELAAWYDIPVEAPISPISPEVVTVRVVDREVTVILGRAGPDDRKIRVNLLRTDEPLLPLVGATTIAVEKAGTWISTALDQFYRNEILATMGQRHIKAARRTERAQDALSLEELPPPSGTGRSFHAAEAHPRPAPFKDPSHEEVVTRDLFAEAGIFHPDK